MSGEPIFTIRLPSGNLEISVAYFKSQGFEVIAVEEIINTVWIHKDNLVFSLCECAAESPMLVTYWEKPEVFLMKLEELSIVCNFAADHTGNHFEAIFTDPGGMTVIVADLNDLPQNCRSISYSSLYELSIPAVPAFTDSINFWNKLDFNPVPDSPRPHPWSRLKRGSLTVGLHQSQNWRRPGLVFLENLPFKNETEVSIDLKSSGMAFVSETVDSTLVYRIESL